MTSGSPAKRVASNPGGSVIFFNASSGASGLSLGFWVLAMPDGRAGGRSGMAGAAERASAAKPIKQIGTVEFMIMLRFMFLFIAREQRAALDTINNPSTLRQAWRKIDNDQSKWDFIKDTR